MSDALLPEPLRLLTAQADVQYHVAPARGIFNPPAATGMGFWSINPYVGCAFGCAYCYARDTHRYTIERAGPVGRRVADGLPPWLAFERRVLVKEQAGARVREALRSSRAPRAGDSLVIGSATDPYQPAERRFGVTRDILEALQPVRGLSLVIITKSPLVTRDIPLLQALARGNRVQVHMSLITVDRELARRLEPRAPTPEARLRGVRRLAESGLEVSVNCMPVLPGITDQPGMLPALVTAVAAAGAQSLGACALRLRAASRRRYLPVVRAQFPELAARYEVAYGQSIHVSDSYRSGLEQYVKKLCERRGIRFRTYRRDGDQEHGAESPLDAAGRTLDGEEEGMTSAFVRQLSLF